MVAPRYSTDWEALSLRLVFGVLAAIAIVFLVAPTLIMLLTSFTASQSLKFPPEGLSLRWYIPLLDADQIAGRRLEQPRRRVLDDGRFGRARHRRGARHRPQPLGLRARLRCSVHVAAAAAGARLRLCRADLHPQARVCAEHPLPCARACRGLRAVRAAHDHCRALAARSCAARCLL